MALFVVTGGAGFIGTNLIKELVAEGHAVKVLDNYIGGRFNERMVPGVEYREGDIRDSDSLRKVMEGAEGVFHLAAVPRVPYSVEQPFITNEHNVTGTLQVLLAARDAKVRRVVFSTSSSIYGGNRGAVAMTEDMKPDPQSPYALQKLAGQEYCRLFSSLYGLETVALCYFNVYGPYMDPKGAYALVIGKFLEQRLKGEPMTICGDGEYFRDYTHVKDIARANVLAMSATSVGKGECINIGNGSPVSVNQLAELIGGETVYVPPRLGDVRYTKADNTKAKQLLGWEPTVSLEQGIAEMKVLWGVT